MSTAPSELFVFGDIKQYFREYSGTLYRILEEQHYIATRQLVDSDTEQLILEELLDASKAFFTIRLLLQNLQKKNIFYDDK